MKNKQQTKQQLKPMITLFKAHRSLLEFIKDDIKKYNFDINEFSVFEIIYHKEKVKINEIKENILIANSSLSYILDKLEKRNLIYREKDNKDKRITYVKLTENGLKKANNIFPEHYETLINLFNILTNEEKEILEKITKKIGIHTKEVLK